jgi:sialate O-acetylesterase
LSSLSARRIATVVAALAAIAFAAAARADVKLPAIFSDHMVLQQGATVPVWGWADEGEEITVTFTGQKHTTRAKGGKWRVNLTPLKASVAPEALTVQGKNRVELKNVVVGEVWVASGQSNMQWGLNQTHEWQKEHTNSANKNLRLFYVPRVKADAPKDDISGQHHGAKPVWMVAGPESTVDFSAVAYYFGRDLQKARQVPVGIIHTSWGGSPAEVWIRDEVMTANADYKRDIVDPYPKSLDNYKAAKAKWDKAAAEAKEAGKKMEGKAPSPPSWKPSELYNSMIAPLIPYAIKGAIWYQGESNAGRAWQYRTLFADMIRNWRKDWGYDFTFLTVELAPFTRILTEPADSNWAELREAQIIASRAVGNAGSVTITDVGEENDIHPKKKEPVGERLALLARKLAYSEKIVADGPTFKGAKFEGNKTTITFDNVGAGLLAKGGDELKGFAVCGEDRKFEWGKAEIKGETVVVTSEKVAKPVAVRFGWANYPVVNLWNKDGLPAHPFRSDNFPLTTDPAAKAAPAPKK